MTVAKCIVAVTAIAFASPVHAQSKVEGAVPPPAASGPLMLIYAVPGVRDSGGGSGTGSATVFHCTNFSTVAENIRFVLRNSGDNIVADQTATVQSANTHTATTHNTAAYFDNLILSPGIVIDQGQALIFATSTFVFCSVMTIDASTMAPVGVALKSVRFNAQPGTQE